MSLSLIDLEMESDPTDPVRTGEKQEPQSTLGFKAVSKDLELVRFGGHSDGGFDLVKAEKTDQTGDQLNGFHSTELTETPKCKKNAKKTKDSQKKKDAFKTKYLQTKYAQKAKDAQKTKDACAVKTNDAQKTKNAQKDAKKAKDAQKKTTGDTEKVIQGEKWGTLRRIVHALGLRASGTSTSPLNAVDLGCDDISFDGHLFEYAPHPTIIPKVAVPRLHLRPTLRERLCNIAHNLFRCGSLKQNNQYTMD